MKILFIQPRQNPFDSTTVREQPCGGTEKVITFLGEALTKKGHEVRTATTVDQMINVDTQWPDVVITQEANQFLKFSGNIKKIWWTHHFTDQPTIQRNSGVGRALSDHVVTLSRCHQADLREHLKIDSVVIPHGIWKSEVETGTKDPNRFIYASTPFRGLDRIPEIFKRISENNPDATVAICSSMATYGEGQRDSEFSEIFTQLKKLVGVEIKGALNQTQLYREYAKAKYLLYPNHWRETYCCALDEAIAHGCTPLVTDIGALPERVTPVDMDKLPLVKDEVEIIKQPQDWMEVVEEWETLWNNE